ncbi:hypothetical protein LY76DRAFT_591617 [Colletotrichum caudatum]|nr:hypothetical protein LY76DRAFT_591617 [Colletotrichum caudatum]
MSRAQRSLAPEGGEEGLYPTSIFYQATRTAGAHLAAQQQPATSLSLSLFWTRLSRLLPSPPAARANWATRVAGRRWSGTGGRSYIGLACPLSTAGPLSERDGRRCTSRALRSSSLGGTMRPVLLTC